MLTQQDFDAIVKREAAASKGPWDQTNYNTVYDADSNLVCREFNAETEIEEERIRVDFDFIAHARTDIPALLAHIDALQAMMREAADKIDCVSPVCMAGNNTGGHHPDCIVTRLRAAAQAPMAAATTNPMLEGESNGAQ